MATYEVFGRRRFDDPLTHVGTLHAADAEAALLLARETHFRHGEGVDFAVCATTDLHRLADPTLLEHQVDVTYRNQGGYSGFRAKREAAREAADARGLGHVRDQPSPRAGSGA
jgi:1,2-phenylacetyl-CoA epoxidase PaaB subunit